MPDFLKRLEESILGNLFRGMRILAHRKHEQIHILEKALIYFIKFQFHSVTSPSLVN